MPRKLQIVRTVEPQTIRVWPERVITAPLRFGIQPEAMLWFQQAPTSREAMEQENQKIRQTMEEMQLASWKQEPIPAVELAKQTNLYLLVGDRSAYVTVKAAQNARKVLVINCYTIGKHDIAFLDLSSLIDEAA